MSNYYVHRSGEDEHLEHSIFQKGVRGSHKYIARMNIGGKMRYFYDPRELAVFKAGGRALGSARKAVGGAVGGAIANVRRNASNFVDRNITGASAKKSYNTQKALERKYSSNSGRRSRDYATRAKKAAQNSQKRYNQSLFGRIENAGKRIANVGNSARNAVGNAAGQAAKAGKNFAGSVSKAAYNAPGAVKNARKKAGKKLADVSGLTARREFYKAADRSMNLRRGIRSRRGETYNPKDPLEIARDRAQKRADSKLWETRARYNKTPLGRIEGAITETYERAGDIKGKLKKRKKRK